ncbi:hypothetical protein Droror1_Dr00003756 [Drosera rotundifolia]
MLSWFRRGRNSPAPPTTSSLTHQNGSDDEFYGVTDKLIEHVKSFTVDTFKNFELPEDVSDEAPTSSGGVRMDLSEWQQQHATIILSKAKEVSQLRYMLCPRHLKERQFWRIYFLLVKSFVTEYELRAIQLEKLKTMAMGMEKSSRTQVIELEMSEATHTRSLLPSPTT